MTMWHANLMLKKAFVMYCSCCVVPAWLSGHQWCICANWASQNRDYHLSNKRGIKWRRFQKRLTYMLFQIPKSGWKWTKGFKTFLITSANLLKTTGIGELFANHSNNRNLFVGRKSNKRFTHGWQFCVVGTLVMKEKKRFSNSQITDNVKLI